MEGCFEKGGSKKGSGLVRHRQLGGPAVGSEAQVSDRGSCRGQDHQTACQEHRHGHFGGVCGAFCAEPSLSCLFRVACNWPPQSRACFGSSLHTFPGLQV